MKIVVTGTRGIPEIQGGVETHCQELFPLIAAQGVDVTVCRRRCYAKDNLTEFRGVKIKDLYAPRRKSIEAAVSTLLGVFYAKRVKADWVHVHAVGPSIVLPIAKLLGLKVIMTHHGFDYERKKWGRFARWAIKSGEKMAARFADKIIVISRPIAERMAEEYGRKDTHLIYNGVPAASPSANTDFIESLGLTPGRYVLALGRIVPEKNFHQLVEAFDVEGYKLVIAGEPDHPDEYSESLKRRGAEAGVIMPGFVRGEQLNQLMTNAALFCLPSSHEGLPITLLEAMSYGRDVLVSDISANRLEQLNETDFFTVNDVEALRRSLREKLASPCLNRTYDLTPYNWPAIASQTLPLYS
ncbi:MAG: glycosyltransferase family 4 protein [Muribaculaceae bacterium]|nr:glycosyltransferase family 4 protein [Muribaculaceae bacterium]